MVQSPTRVDLSGGTLDCWPLYLLFEDCITINLSISPHTFVELTPWSDDSIHLEIKSYSFNKRYANFEEFCQDGDPKINLIRVLLRYWKPPTGFHLVTGSGSPIGGGLGGSSSLCISLIKAFSQWLCRPLEKFEMVRLASDLEAQVLKKPTGTQDYFPAIEPGLHFIHYRPGEILHRVEKVDKHGVTDHLLLVDTGRAHHSGFNNWQVIKQAIDGEKATIKRLKGLREISFSMKDCLSSKAYDELPDLFEEEYENRVALSPHFTSPEIEALQSIAQSFNGQVKICGAGGGGSVLIWVPPVRRELAKEQLISKGYRLIDFEMASTEGQY